MDRGSVDGNPLRPSRAAVCFPHFWKDALYLMKVIRYGARLEIFKRSSRVVTVIDRFVQQAQRIPEKAFVVYEGVTYTYKELEARSNRVARVFLDAVRKGDTVALLMSNEPDFIAVWFGFSKLGCAVAFLNTNIKPRSLLHCLNCCGAKLLVVGAGTLIPDTLQPHDDDALRCVT